MRHETQGDRGRNSQWKTGKAGTQKETRECETGYRDRQTLIMRERKDKGRGGGTAIGRKKKEERRKKKRNRTNLTQPESARQDIETDKHS